MPPTASAHPIHTLCEQATALEAAITLTLAKPKKDPVHRLRTSTRRIEALLELLDLLPDLPDHRKPAKKVRHLLRKLRQAAGTVRDLDVQRSLIKNPADADAASDKLRRDARHLRHTLSKQRSDEADKLVKLLAAAQRKLSPALEKLLKELEPAADLTLSSSELTKLVREWYGQNTPDLEDQADPDSLHAVRKSAKLARYIAEAGASGLASRFECLQQTGGAWHDLLTLAESSRHHLGKKSPLTQLFRQQQTEAINNYREALRNDRE